MRTWLRHRRWLTASILGVLATMVGMQSANAATPTPPGQPSSGYGSTANYIATSATRYETGNGSDGTRVWWFVPNRLRNGSSAPVVVFLHGFMLLAPDIYQGHIDHLTKQGFIVIYPQFNKGGITGLISDTDQRAMLQRAIDATNVALGRLDARADRGQLHLYGHSLGGLMGAAWLGAGGPAVRSITLANPSIDPAGAIPSFVRSFVKITPIDYAALAPATRVRTVILTGDSDTIAQPTESVALWRALTNAPDKVVYQASSDSHGSPALAADHMAPIQNQGWVPDFMMKLFGGVGRQDTLDWRYYYAALDSNIAGTTRVPFDLGRWSDGVPVAAPVELAR
ncbi:MAG: hypothetical protein N2037_02955 [Acidimicrobiales bacterium]|nr:hypothetical protein [Acidimicrobiales bacterium]